MGVHHTSFTNDRKIYGNYDHASIHLPKAKKFFLISLESYFELFYKSLHQETWNEQTEMKILKEKNPMK